MKTAITVSNLDVQYNSARRRSLLNIMTHHMEKSQLVEALKKVSFEIPKGEIVGIIGSNGSGKSTLLRTLAGLIAPNGGTVDLHGNSVSLLALGTGFLPDLSGHDNIILCGLSMGFSRKEIEEKYPSIVDFSELGEAINRPVKTYSSGMYSKLAFSIAVTLRTDILLVDEVLSVGDARFREKSRKAMLDIINEKQRTVVIVSHNMGEIKNLCNRVIWLERGHINEVGQTEEVLEDYYQHLAKDPGNLAYLEPPKLKVTPYADRVHLEWDAVPNAEDYRIYRKECIVGARWSTICEGYTDLHYDDVPPSGRVVYQYTIRARATNRAGNVWSQHGNTPKGQLKKN